jgi:hypothetical protein
MVGATAFMETLGSRSSCVVPTTARTASGSADLYPYTEDAVGAVRRSVLQWRSSTGRREDRRDRSRRAQQAKDAVQPTSRYAALGA